MTGPPRYWNVFRRTPSGRDQKRILNRAVTCPLCGKALGTDRAPYCAYTGSIDHEFIAAHPGCAGEHMRQLAERLQNPPSVMSTVLAFRSLLLPPVPPWAPVTGV